MFITFKDKPVYFTGEDGERYHLKSYIIKTRTYMGVNIDTNQEKAFTDPMNLEWVSFERYSSNAIKVFTYSAIEYLVLSGFSNYQDDELPQSIRQLLHNALYVMLRELKDNLSIMYDFMPDEIERQKIHDEICYMHPDFLSITASDLIVTASKDVNRDRLNEMMLADNIEIIKFKPREDSRYDYALRIRNDIFYPCYLQY